MLETPLGREVENVDPLDEVECSSNVNAVHHDEDVI
jgi:hypothetical protein